MRPSAMLINTSRGGLVDTTAVSETFATGRLGYVGLDVYGDEAERFYEDHSDRLLADPVLGRLLSMPNVIATSHQGFFTVEALTAIAETNVRNASAGGYPCTPRLPDRQKTDGSGFDSCLSCSLVVMNSSATPNLLPREADCRYARNRALRKLKLSPLQSGWPFDIGHHAPRPVSCPLGCQMG